MALSKIKYFLKELKKYDLDLNFIAETKFVELFNDYSTSYKLTMSANVMNYPFVIKNNFKSYSLIKERLKGRLVFSSQIKVIVFLDSFISEIKKGERW